MKRLHTENKQQKPMAGIPTMFFSSGATGVPTSQGCFGRDKYIHDLLYTFEVGLQHRVSVTKNPSIKLTFLASCTR